MRVRCGRYPGTWRRRRRSCNEHCPGRADVAGWLVTLAVDASNLLHAQDIVHGVADPLRTPRMDLPEQIAAVAGPALDAIAEKFDTSLAAFDSFNESQVTRRFYSIVGPPIAAKRAALEAAIGQFGDREKERYGARWTAAYRRGIYYIAVNPGPATAGISVARASGASPQIRYARYVSSRSGRALDVTYALQSACLAMSRQLQGCLWQSAGRAIRIRAKKVLPRSLSVQRSPTTGSARGGRREPDARVRAVGGAEHRNR